MTATASSVPPSKLLRGDTHALPKTAIDAATRTLHAPTRTSIIEAGYCRKTDCLVTHLAPAFGPFHLPTQQPGGPAPPRLSGLCPLQRPPIAETATWPAETLVVAARRQSLLAHANMSPTRRTMSSSAGTAWWHISHDAFVRRRSSSLTSTLTAVCTWRVAFARCSASIRAVCSSSYRPNWQLIVSSSAVHFITGFTRPNATRIARRRPGSSRVPSPKVFCCRDK